MWCGCLLLCVDIVVTGLLPLSVTQRQAMVNAPGAPPRLQCYPCGPAMLCGLYANVLVCK